MKNATFLHEIVCLGFRGPFNTILKNRASDRWQVVEAIGKSEFLILKEAILEVENLDFFLLYNHAVRDYWGEELKLHCLLMTNR